MDRDTREFVAACVTCARSKTSNQPSSSLLEPLPMPSQPWSHISLDFITGLPPNGKTVILIIVDRFSEAVHLLVLSKLLMAKEMADQLVAKVFCIHESHLVLCLIGVLNSPQRSGRLSPLY